jgi:hypothetical protein
MGFDLYFGLTRKVQVVRLGNPKLTLGSEGEAFHGSKPENGWSF